MNNLKQSSNGFNDQNSLYKKMNEYSENGAIPFHMPGHKRNVNKFEFLSGLAEKDITEIEGFDNLSDANGVIFQSMCFASSLWNSKQTYFCVNGSTGCLLSAIFATTNANDKVIVARNCHKAVYNAVALNRLKPIYVMPKLVEDFECFGQISPQSIKKLLEQNPDVKLVVITSPTYEGIISDITEISKIVHSYGALLLVDEAHGAHLGFGYGFKQSAVTCGADIVNQSLHKTMPSPNQCALLHICSDRVDQKKVKKFLSVFQTSSPSYPMLASMDRLMHVLKNNSDEVFLEWKNELDSFNDFSKKLKNLRVLGYEGNRNGFYDFFDRSKILINFCGENACNIMSDIRVRFGIEAEYANKNNILFISGAGDSKNSFEVLKKALEFYDNKMENILKNSKKESNAYGKNIQVLPKLQLYPYEIDYSNVEYVKIDNSQNRVCAEKIFAYPPGIPIIADGELIEKAQIEQIQILCESGAKVISETCKFPYEILVVKK